jgi:perosamine synthetase
LTALEFMVPAAARALRGAELMFVDIGLDTADIHPDLMEDAITFPVKPTLPGAAFCASTHPRASLSPHGNPRPDGRARLDAIREIADRHGLMVILVVLEDSCESLGSENEGVKARHGAFSHGAVFAFYPNKQITTGEGGMIVTDDNRTARLCRSMCNQGRGGRGVALPRTAGLQLPHGRAFGRARGRADVVCIEGIIVEPTCAAAAIS